MTRAEAMKKNRVNKPVGAVRKITADVKELAGQYTQEAIERLAFLAVNADSHAAQVAAIKELLNRACGLPHQAITAEVNQSGRLIIEYVNDWRKRGDGDTSPDS